MNSRYIAAAFVWMVLPVAGWAAPAAGAAGSPSVLVSTQTPVSGSIPDTLTAYGTAVPAMNGGMTLSVQSDGRVLQLFVTPGEAVRTGQRLLEFEISAAARSNYEQATSTVELAREEQTRTARLFSQQLATRDQVARADKAVADAQAALRALEREYGGKPRQTLLAPFDGVVGTMPVAQGVRVQPGTPLITLTRTGGLVVTVGVEPAQRARLRTGQPAQVEAINGADPAQSGQIARIDHVLNPTTRLVDADVAVPGALLQGQAFRVRIEVGRIKGWLLPRDAVLSDQDGAYVFQVANGAAVRVAVKLLGGDDTTSVVDGPVDAHRPVVTQGNYQLNDGMAVRQGDAGPPGAPAQARDRTGRGLALRSSGGGL